MNRGSDALSQKNSIFKNYIIALLEETCPFDYELQRKLIYGTNGSRVSIRTFIDSFEYDAYSDVDDAEEVLDTIVEILNKYVISLHAPAKYKQKIAKKLCDWAYIIAEKLDIDDPEIDGAITKSYYVPDMTVEIIKSLHFDQDAPDRGITKKKLCEDYNLKSTRSIEEFFARLSGKENKEPLRIAGQAVKTKVDFDGKEGTQRKYYTNDTISPVFIPANITQVKTLLKGLYHESRQKKDPFAMTLAIDIWSQLSPYARARVRKIYGTPDKNFNDFLNSVEKKSKDIFIYYRDEADYSEDILDADNEYILGYVEKHGLNCTILFVDENVDAIENARVHYSSAKRSYVAVTENGEQLFDPKDVWEIDIIK